MSAVLQYILVLCAVGRHVGAAVSTNLNNHLSSNHRTERRSSRFFSIPSLRSELSPTRTLKWPWRNRVQTACHTQTLSTYNTWCATWYEGTAQPCESPAALLFPCRDSCVHLTCTVSVQVGSSKLPVRTAVHWSALLAVRCLWAVQMGQSCRVCWGLVRLWPGL